MDALNIFQSIANQFQFCMRLNPQQTHLTGRTVDTCQSNDLIFGCHTTERSKIHRHCVCSVTSSFLFFESVLIFITYFVFLREKYF